MKIGGGGYSTIDATSPTRNGRWDSIQSWYSQPGNAEGWAYQVRADVTPEVNAGLEAGQGQGGADQSLKVTVADVQAGKGFNRYGGWNLVVVWTTPTAPWRNVTLFDGFDFVQVKGGEQLVVGPLNFTGFQTPESGNVDAHATVWATEGDRAITGDYLSLGNQSTSCTAPAQAARRRPPGRQLLQQHDLQRRQPGHRTRSGPGQPTWVRPRHALGAQRARLETAPPARRSAWARSATRTSSEAWCSRR